MKVGLVLSLLAAVLILLAPPPPMLSSSIDTVEIYLYMLVVETDSDWASVEFSSGPTVVCYNFTLTQGPEAPGLWYNVRPRLIYISKQSHDTTFVSINVLVVALKGDESSTAIIKKGDVGNVKVSMYIWKSGDYELDWSVVSEGVNLQYPGTNDRTFSVNFKKLYEQPASIAIYESLAEGFKECVLAFYYPWYGTAHGASGRWFHWEGVTENSIANTAHYPLLGIYDSQDERLIESHILMAKYAGIDGFVVSWWGPDSFEDQSLERIIRVAEIYDFKITIYYESYRPRKPLTSVTDIVYELSYAIREYTGSSAFFKVNGRPVIFIYNIEAHDRSPGFWLQVRRDLEEKVGPVCLIGDLRDPSYLYVFDGFHTYIELNSSSMRELYAFYRNYMRIGLVGLNFSEAVDKIKAGDCVNLQEKALFYTVIPGFDNREIGEPGLFVDRGGGATYERFWCDALEMNAKCVLITSWNELHEGTEIEPTREYGLVFLNMTRNYTSKLKQRSIEEPPLPSLNLSASFYRGSNELSIKLFNEGEGAAIAVRVQILLPTGIIARFTDAYRQPSGSGVKVAVIPLLKSGEDYRLTLKVENVSGGTFTFQVTYYSVTGLAYSMGFTNKPPIASFTYLPSIPTIRDVVNFYDASNDPDGSIVSWYWDFGDGNTSTDRNPMHKYLDKGAYTVRLVVTDNAGGEDSTTEIIRIVNLAPTADFTHSPSEPIEGQDIQFTDKSSDPEGRLASWIWDFGDGYKSTSQNPTHRYTKAGTYTVTLTVADDEGVSSTKYIHITILAPPFWTQTWFYAFILSLIGIAIAATVILRRRTAPKIAEKPQ
ncbi:MAG: PKD domain-containing protein [Thermoproteota archaeon]